MDRKSFISKGILAFLGLAVVGVKVEEPKNNTSNDGHVLQTANGKPTWVKVEFNPGDTFYSNDYKYIKGTWYKPDGSEWKWESEYCLIERT